MTFTNTISKDLSIQRSLSHLFFYNHFFVIITRLNNLCRKLLPNKVSFLFIRQIILISIRIDNHRNSNNRYFLFMFYKNSGIFYEIFKLHRGNIRFCGKKEHVKYNVGCLFATPAPSINAFLHLCRYYIH